MYVYVLYRKTLAVYTDSVIWPVIKLVVVVSNGDKDHQPSTEGS
jgi:hypothetical protein